VTETAAPRRTPLYEAHVAAGGRLVEFAGWSMPVQYAGVLAEHAAVRTRAGLFDVSHMGQASIRGPGALAFLQGVTCNDVSRLTPGRAHYNALTTPEGAFIDDLLVYMLAPGEFVLVLNASNTAKDLAWLKEHSAGPDVEVVDVSDRWALLALQGPRAVDILRPLTGTELSTLRYYGFVRAAVAGADCIVARTGYTGEDGFELFAPAETAASLWEALMRAGGSHGLMPAGLAARDTLRLEAKMALYGNDIDESTTVLEADLGWIVKLDKGPFVGRDALVLQHREGVARKLVGFEMTGRSIARRGYAAYRGAERVGTVTSGSYGPWIKRNIGLAYLPAGMWEPGTALEVEIRGRREPAVVVPTPFYKRSR
jgi:aminomethyltransferase